MRAKICAARLKSIECHYDNRGGVCLRAKLRTGTSPNILSAFSSQISILYVTWQYFKSIKSRKSQSNMYQVPWSCGRLSQYGRGIRHVITCNEAVLSAKFITYLNANYQMTLYLLISWRDISLWFFPGLKCRSKNVHLLVHSVPPQCITILAFDLNWLLCIIWYLYPELVSLQLILGFRFCNYVIPPS